MLAWQARLIGRAPPGPAASRLHGRTLGHAKPSKQPALHVLHTQPCLPSAPSHHRTTTWPCKLLLQLCISPHNRPATFLPPAAGVPDVQLPTYELLYAEVLQYSMARKEDDDMRFDSGHKNPTISFDTELMTTGLLWTPDKPDSPWIEPTKPSWSRKIAALSGAVQQYLKASYSKSQRIAPDRVADSILTYMDKQLAMKGDAGAIEFGEKP